jgi:hypothetical protein
MQAGLADLERILTHRIEDRALPHEDEKWSQGAHEVLSLLKKARDVRGDIVGRSLAHLAERLAPPSGKPAVKSNSTERRAMVDAYIEEVRREKGKRITRKDIWSKAGYTSRTEFERWERRDAKHPNQVADEIFTRILREKPHLK